jgi:hypothetical protein
MLRSSKTESEDFQIPIPPQSDIVFDNCYKVGQAPRQDLYGRIEKGFDFLGYHFSPQGLSLAQKTIDNFVEKALRLYEQEPPHQRMKRLGEY